MVVTKSVERRWFKRYKLYLILGGLIFVFQIYLALKFFTISGDTVPQNEWSPQFLDPADLGNENSVNSARKSKDSLALDDEDSHRNLIAVKNSKIRVVNQPRLRVEELDFKPSCEITGREAISAIHRAKTQRCKWEIANITCLISENRFYPKNLPNSCPNNGLQVGRSLGCYKDEKNYRLLSGYYSNNKELNSPEYCIGLCLQSGFPYAGVQYSTECFCGNDEPPAVSKLPDSSCNMKCPANSNQICGGYFTINIYETGINKFFPQTATTAISNNKPIKIVFLLTFNGRALRQVKRLVKILFHVDHYFYIHVDIRQDYLFRELLTLERNYPNIKLTRTRFATIWGGTSLLRMLLSTMRELLLESDWQWDFVLNLSESDYPVKPLKRLVDFLTSNPEMNFVKSHGREVQRFIQKQGLDKTFVECDTHMWRTGDRHLPYGIQIDGGSDWVALSRGFVHYVTAEAPDELVAGLLVIFNHTLLPAESFFHTVLRNSVFCNRYVDNNLHVTNWKRKLGCKCQYKHVVDWCGCSPNDFTPDDWPRIQNTETRQLFFARKFEPIVNQAVILQLEQWLYGHTLNANLTNINAYWQSIYNSLDLGTIFDDSLMTLVHSILRIAFKCEKLVKVREVTSYHLNDSYNRTLVLFDSGNVTSRVELGFKQRPGKLKVRKNNIGMRVKKLQVSSDYDQKEQISRNFLRILGPYSEPVLVYNFSAGNSANNLTVVWIDPIGHLAELAELSLDETPTVGHLKCGVRQPLLPGSWKVVLTYINNNKNSNKYKQIVVIAELEFLVTPLTFYAGNAVIGGDQVEYIHSGAIETYVREYDALWEELQTLLPTSVEIEVLERTAAANAKRFGLDLDEWVDQLVGKFYKVDELCATGRESVHVCGVTVVERCVDCEWSTKARDPKSEIGLVNDKGGFDLW